MRLIDADALKELFPDNGEGLWTYNRTARMYIDNAPTIKTYTLADIEEQYRKGLEKGLSEWEAERPTGEWKITEAYPHKVYCDKCYKTYAQENWEVWKDGSLPRYFCPNCGAKMITPESLIDKVGPVLEQIAETATNFFEDETISGLLEEGEND